MKELTQEELRAALDAADRGLRLPMAEIIVAVAGSALAVGFAIKVLDFSNPTHVLIVCSVVFLYAQAFLLSGLIATRQNAANARMLKALELIEERVAGR